MHAQVVQGRYFCLRLFMFGLWRCLYFINIRSALGPPCIHEHNARETARRAHHDAFGNDRGAPWRGPTGGGG